jgi:hypothetical protein
VSGFLHISFLHLAAAVVSKTASKGQVKAGMTINQVSHCLKCPAGSPEDNS